MITFDDVLNEFVRYKVKVTDDVRVALQLTFATKITSKWAEDPLWMFIVGTSSSGKTLVLNSLAKTKGVHYESSLHPQALVSGYVDPDDPDADNSLIPYLMEVGTLVLKDYTEMLSLPKQVRNDVDRILRGVYDKTVNKTYGHGKHLSYEGQFNIIAGATPILYETDMETWGDRWCYFHMPRPKKKVRKSLVMNAIRSPLDDVRSKALSSIVAKFLQQPHLYRIPNPNNYISMRHAEQIYYLTEAMVRVKTRTNWKAGWGQQRELSVRPETIMPTRLAKQLTKLILGLMVIDNARSVTDEHLNVAERVAINTAHGLNLDIVAAMMAINERCDAQTIANAARLPEETVFRRMEELTAIGVTTTHARPIARGLKHNSYTVSKSIQKLWKKAHLDGKRASKILRCQHTKKYEA